MGEERRQKNRLQMETDCSSAFKNVETIPCYTPIVPKQEALKQ